MLLNQMAKVAVVVAGNWTGDEYRFFFGTGWHVHQVKMAPLADTNSGDACALQTKKDSCGRSKVDGSSSVGDPVQVPGILD